METAISNLGSGHFEENVPNLSPHQINQNNDAEYIEFFLELLIKESGNKLDVTHVAKNTSPQKVHLLVKDGLFYLEGIQEYKNSDTVYFNHLSKTFFFFIENTQTDGFKINTLYQLHRRKWRRYNLEDQGIEITLIEQGGKEKIGKILNVTNEGLLMSIDSTPDLFQGYQAHIDGVNFGVQIVHVQEESNGKGQVGLHVVEQRQQFLTEFYRKKMDLFGLKGKILDESMTKDEVKNIFAEALNPQFYTDSYVDPDPKANMYLLERKNGRYTSISSYQVNSHLAHIHTLLLSPEDFEQVPANLYEYAANHSLLNDETEYFSGYWPSNYKMLDRSFTAFAKTNDGHIGQFYKKITIYQSKVDTNQPESSDLITRKYTKQDYPHVVGLIQSQVNDVFYDAHHIEQKLEQAENDDSILITEKNSQIVCVSVIFPSNTDIKVFGLVDQAWIFFKEGEFDMQWVKSARIKISEYFEKHAKTNYSIHTLQFHEELLAQSGIDSHIKNINCWIIKKEMGKPFLNHLETLAFEVSVLSKLKKITKKHAKYLKSQKSTFVRRNSLRYKDESLNQEVAAHILLDEEIQVKVLDIDTFGMRVEIPSDYEITKGKELRIKLEITNTNDIYLKAKTTHTQSNLASGFGALTNNVGLKFIDMNQEAVSNVKEFCFHKLNPDLSEFTNSDYNEVINLFKRSGYLDYYKTNKDRNYVFDAEKTYRSIELTVPDLAKVTVLKSDDGNIIGTHSFYRKTSCTWQLHQLVVDEDRVLYKTHIPTKMILNGSFQYLCLDPSVKYFMTYFSDKAAIAKSYFSFRTEHDNPSDYAYVEYRGFLYNCTNKLDKGNFSEYDISEATEDEIEIIQGYLITLVPDIEYKAFSYDDLLQDKFNEKWNKRKLPRNRKVFVLRDRKKNILLFAIADISPLGINLLGVHDSFRVFDVPWSGVKHTENMFQTFAEYVVGFYKNKGRILTYLEVHPSIENYFVSGRAKNLGKNWRLIGSRPTFMTALNYYKQRFERLEKRLNK